MPLSRATCVYFNCKRSRSTHPELSFFRFPLDTVRSSQWFENCGNDNLSGSTLEQLNKKTVCAKHFSINSFVNARHNSLVHNAVPVHYNNDPEDMNNSSLQLKRNHSPEVLILNRESGAKTYGSYNLKNNSDFASFSSDNDTVFKDPIESKNLEVVTDVPIAKKIRKDYEIQVPTLKTRNQHLQRKIRAKNSHILRLRKLVTKSSVNCIDGLPKNVRVFVTMQVSHKYKHPWTKDEKDLALSLYYKSPALYLFMRDTLKFTLPSKSTISTWLRMSQLSTGIDPKLFQKLHHKVDSMTTDERECVLLMDEMSIKRSLDYNSSKDLIEGFQDLDHLGRENKVANQALVFMVRGLTKKWKIPISYYLSATSIKHHTLKCLIVKNIEALEATGLNVRVLIGDQAASNRAAFQNLGVTEETPFFYVNDKKIFAMYDLPHLVKSIRNNLMVHDIFVEGNKVSWDDIKTCYNIDKQSTTARALPKISECHISPNTFQKMRVKYATQIFSKSVSDAIRTCIKTGQMDSPSALNTANFLLSMNDLFDILNSRLLNSSNPYQCALSIRRPNLEVFLHEAKYWVSTWRVYTNTQKVNEGIYCFRGLTLSIQAVLLLWEEMKSNGFQFILTSRLNQDPLENLFSAIRRRSGNNSNPSAKAFRQSLQWNMLIRFLKPPKNSNCEADDDVSMELKNISELDCINEIESKEDNGNEDDHDLDIIDFQSSENLKHFKTVTLEECAITYVAGYVVYKTQRKFNNCKQCHELSVEDILNNKSALLLIEKDYSKGSVQYLKKPSDVVINIVTSILKTFESYFPLNQHKANFKKDLMNICIKNVKLVNPSWLSMNCTCYEHQLFLVKHLISCKIHKTLKWISQDLRTVGFQKERKNKKIKHLAHL